MALDLFRSKADIFLPTNCRPLSQDKTVQNLILNKFCFIYIFVAYGKSVSWVNLEQGEVGECGLGRAGLGAGWSVPTPRPRKDSDRKTGAELGPGPELPVPADGDLNAGSVQRTARGCGSRIHFHHKTVTTFPDLPAWCLWSGRVMTPGHRDICWWHIQTSWHHDRHQEPRRRICPDDWGQLRPSINYNYVNDDGR